MHTPVARNVGRVTPRQAVHSCQERALARFFGSFVPTPKKNSEGRNSIGFHRAAGSATRCWRVRAAGVQSCCARSAGAAMRFDRARCLRVIKGDAARDRTDAHGPVARQRIARSRCAVHARFLAAKTTCNTAKTGRITRSRPRGGCARKCLCAQSLRARAAIHWGVSAASSRETSRCSCLARAEATNSNNSTSLAEHSARQLARVESHWRGRRHRGDDVGALLDAMHCCCSSRPRD
jgi:hypothetical protein